MAFDFPAFPVDGTVFTDPTTGVQYQAQSGIWYQVSAAQMPLYVPVYQGVIFGVMPLGTGAAQLYPWKGGLLTTGEGKVVRCPSGGVSIAAIPAQAAVFGWVYASDANADGVLDLLEFSTTAPTEGTLGIKHLPTVPSKTLVGCSRMVPGNGFFAQSDNSYTTRSWFNEPTVALGGGAFAFNPANGVWTDGASVTVFEAALWKGELFEIEFSLNFASSSNVTTTVGFAWDGATAPAFPAGVNGNLPRGSAASGYQPLSGMSSKRISADGYSWGRLKAIGSAAGSVIENGAMRAMINKQGAMQAPY